MPRQLTTDERRTLRSLGRRITKLEQERERLYGERLDLFRQLHGDGVRQAEIAKAAGVGTSAVGFALHHHAKKAGAGEASSPPDPSPLASTGAADVVAGPAQSAVGFPVDVGATGV